LLAEEAGMYGTEAADAVQRLMKGKFVDAYFDLGEDAAARAFMKQAEQFGLRTKLHQDSTVPWYGAPPRPWFVKYTIGGGLTLVVLWLAVRQTWPETVLSRIMTTLLFCFMISIPFVGSVRKEPESEEMRRLERTTGVWLRVGVPLFIALVAGVIQEPWLGIILFLILFAGIGFFLLIRAMHRNS
jgi:hypothetical protein